MEPRAVIVTRPTEYEQLQGTYGTISNASFSSNVAVASTSTRRAASHKDANVGKSSRYASTSSMQESGKSSLSGGNLYVETLEKRHSQFHKVKASIGGAIPSEWRKAVCPRAELDRFLFEPDDIVIVIGQDGLVANVAKYLKDKQLVIGFNPEPERNPGALVRHHPREAHELFQSANHKELDFEVRTLAQATLSSGQTLVGLNEIFIGHRSHQSARYELTYGVDSEDQSSSGILIGTGTGSTGWCKSLIEAQALDDVPGEFDIPDPEDEFLMFLVREAWESPFSSTDLTYGNTGKGYSDLLITSDMETSGVIFTDGIENDYLEFNYGVICEIDVADQKLYLA